MSDRLIALRNRSGLTPDSIADKLSITATNYRRYETGERRPTMEILARLACVLGVSMDELMEP